MMFSQLSFGALALFTSLQGVVAIPAPGDAVEDTIKSPHEVLDIVEVGGLNITLYGNPNEEPEIGAAHSLNKRCGSNVVHCDNNWKNLAEVGKCLDLINSPRDPQFSNSAIPNGLKSMCGGRQANKAIVCCISFEQNLSGTGAHYSDLVGAAFDVYSKCPQKALVGDHWLTGWTTDTLLGGKCGNQCLSAASSC